MDSKVSGEEGVRAAYASAPDNVCYTVIRPSGLVDGARKGVGFMRGHLPSSESATLNYGEFRNFLCLLPPERLHVDPNRAWFEASTIVSVGKPPVAEGMALKSAIAGASAAGLSTICLHPIDTLKCLVQVSPKGESMVAIAKRILSRGAPTGSWKQLYRGMWPAFFGSSAMHGLRTGGYETAQSKAAVTVHGAARSRGAPSMFSAVLSRLVVFSVTLLSIASAPIAFLPVGAAEG